MLNPLCPRIKCHRSKQNRKIFILRLLFFVSPLRYTQSRGSARALFRLCNQRLLRSLHFRSVLNGGGIMLRALLVLPVASRHRHSTPASAKKNDCVASRWKINRKKGKGKSVFITLCFRVFRYGFYYPSRICQCRLRHYALFGNAYLLFFSFCSSFFCYVVFGILAN